MAPTVVRSLITILCERIDRIETLAAVDKYANESSYRRRLAYDRLTVRFCNIAPGSVNDPALTITYLITR